MEINKLLCTIFFTIIVETVSLAQTAIQTLNDGWAFSEDQIHWQQVSLPHTWNTDAYQTQNYRQGKYYYKRTLRLPSGLRHYLKLEGTNKTSTVYVNGQEVATHKGGYTASVIDLTPFLESNQHTASATQGYHVVDVLIAVDNADKQVAPISADFTFMGGIYRNVCLITTTQQHFSMTEDGSDGVFVSVDSVSDSEAKVSVKCRLRNDAPSAKDCYLKYTLIAPDGKEVACSKKRVRLQGEHTQEFCASLPAIKSPILWSPEHPNLYRIKTELLAATTVRSSKQQMVVLDSQEHHVGMRWCQFDAEKGFFLNGKPYKLNGMCRHQDQRPYGVALDDDMHRRDMQLLKDMGCNFVRLAHYPQAQAVLDACDKMGLLVWEEIPVVNYVPDDEAFADNAAQQLREMIRQHYNHPSVILWGYMNEILLKTHSEYPKQADFDKAIGRIQSLAGKLEKIVHEEDAIRHSVMALHGSDDYNKYHVADVTQVIGWNLYQGWYGGDLTGFERYLEGQHQAHPTHPIIVSEWGAGSDLRLHSHDGKAFDFSCEYQQKYVEHYLPIISQTPYILGGSYWNFVDFSSANRGESMPHINNKGVVTPERQKKDVYYYFQAAWCKDVPVVHIATRDWKVRETTDAHQRVKVYANAAEVSLYHNGNLVGTHPVSNYFALFDVVWQEGENRLSAKVNGAIDQTVLTYRQVPTDAQHLSDVAVNVGSHCYFQSAKMGVTWQPDRAYEPGSWGYVGGKPFTTQAAIACTEDDPLFQTMREGIEAYRFDVPEGNYELQLLFTDVRKRQAQSIYLLGKDKAQEVIDAPNDGFDVEVNGRLIERGFVPGKEIGYFSAVRRSYQVSSAGDGVRVKFVGHGGKTFLSAIRLRKL